MIISILGCGWYGKPLGIELIKRGITVKGSTTSPEKIDLLEAEGIQPYLINLIPDNQIVDDDFFACDILWVSIPPKARAGRGAEYIAQLNELILLVKKHQIKNVVLISSTGVYGDHNRALNENDDPQPDNESGRILFQAEQLLTKESDFTTTIIRFGGLYGPGRDAGRFFAGKTNIPNGEVPINLIHLTDCIGVSIAIIEKNAFGKVFNAVNPAHPTRADFYTKAAEISGLEKPVFIKEKKGWKIIESVNVPDVLQYTFKETLA